MNREDTPCPNPNTEPIPQSPGITLTHHYTPNFGTSHDEYRSRDSTTLNGSDTNQESPSKIFSEKNAACSRVQKPAGSQPHGKWKLAIKQTLGLSGSFVIILGTVGLLGVFAFLTFLWFGYGSKSEAANATWVWRQIALRGYMEQAITLAALVLAVIVALQATVCTSMIAALVLEKRSVPKAKTGFLSILRAVNDGPQKLIEILLSFRTWSVFLHVELWLILLLAIVDVTLRFSSTILLSDMNQAREDWFLLFSPRNGHIVLTSKQHDYTIVGDAKNAPVLSLVPPTATSDDLKSAMSYYITVTGNAVCPVFGEAKPINDSLDPSTSGLSDTGLVQRAFLPMSQSLNRTAVRRYTGNAMVLDSRTVCMPPSMNASISRINLDGYDVAVGMLDGVLEYGSTLRQATDGDPALCDSGECQKVGFHCSIPSGIIPSSSFCLVSGIGGSVFSAAAGIDTQSWNPLEPAWSRNNSIFMVFSTNMDGDSWNTLEDNSEPLKEDVTYGEWQSFELLPGRFVNISLCFMAFSMDRYYVHMNTSGGLLEPSNLWSVLPPYYDTTATRRYLGLLPNQNTENYVDRGILELEILGPSEQNDTLSSLSSADNVTDMMAVEQSTEHFMDQILYNLLTSIAMFNLSFGACWNCSYNGQITRGEVMLVLEDVLSTTGRAASVLQSYVAMTAFWIYTSVLSSMGTAETVQLAVTSVARTPGPCWGSNSDAGPFSARGCPGYTAVTVLLGVHMLTVAAITVRFARQVRFSRCSNIWHAISQLAVSGWLKDHWDKGTNLGDDAYEKLVVDTSKGRDDDERWVRLDRTVDEGRVEFVRSRRRS